MPVADNIAAVRERIARAAARVGRAPESITLMAVSKTVEPARIREAYAAGFACLAKTACRSSQKRPLRSAT